MEDCCMLSIHLAVPSCFNSFWHGVLPTSKKSLLFKTQLQWNRIWREDGERMGVEKRGLGKVVKEGTL